MAHRGRGQGTKHVGTVKPHKEDFDSHVRDLEATFYEPASMSKRMKMSGGNQTRVLKSPHKIPKPRHKHRKHHMPAIPFEKDVVKKKVVTSEEARKIIEVKAEVPGKFCKSKDEESSLSEIGEELGDLNDNLIMTPSMNFDTQDQTIMTPSMNFGTQDQTLMTPSMNFGTQNQTIMTPSMNFGTQDQTTITPSMNFGTQNQTVIVDRNSQDVGSEGETSIMRSKLSEQQKIFELEVLRKEGCEVHLKDKILEEKNKQKMAVERIESRRMFLKQDLQVLGQTLKRKENDLKRKEIPSIIEESESEEEGREDSSEKSSENAIDDTNKKARESSRKCGVVKPPAVRHCVVEVRDKTRLAVERLFLMSEGAGWDEKASLMMRTPTSQLPDVLSSCLATLSSEVTRALPRLGGELSEMLRLTESLHHLLSVEESLLITETCVKVLQSINQSGERSSLASLLSLLQLAWTPRLELSEELSSAVIASIYDLVSLGDVSSVINPELVSQVFRLLSVISSHPQHYGALCQGGGEGSDCPVHMISFLTHYCSRKEVACEGLTGWLLLSQRMSPYPAWVDNSCKKCTHEVIRNLVLMLERQVTRVVVDLHSIDQVRTLLEACVVVLKNYQDQLGVRTWRGMFKIAATIRARYVWAVKRMSRMSLASGIINKLNALEI